MILATINFSFTKSLQGMLMPCRIGDCRVVFLKNASACHHTVFRGNASIKLPGVML